MRIVTALLTEQTAALQVLFQHLPTAQAVLRVRGGQALLAEGGEPAARLLVARKGGAIVGAALAQVLPGATGVLWPPCAIRGSAQPQLIEDALLHEALAWLRRGGARLAQAVLAAEDRHLGAALMRNGFVQPTKLVYLQRKPSHFDVKDNRFATYLDVSPAVFRDTLTESQQGSLDFPEIDGQLSVREVLQGYQAAGYDPARWWLRYDDDVPIGVLILSALTGDTWDLTYLGVVPIARRRGHGNALVRKALTEAHSAGASLLNVSVDARNEPALDLYRDLGFEELERRDVLLCIWEGQ